MTQILNNFKQSRKGLIISTTPGASNSFKGVGGCG